MFISLAPHFFSDRAKKKGSNDLNDTMNCHELVSWLQLDADDDDMAMMMMMIMMMTMVCWPKQRRAIMKAAPPVQVSAPPPESLFGSLAC